MRSQTSRRRVHHADHASTVERASADLAGIRALRARLGDRLTAVALYTGPLAYTHEDGTMVLPLDFLWR